MMSTNNNQPRVLCTWELGGALGHITRLAQISRELQARGYQCYLALKDLSQASQLFACSNATLLQAPVFLPKIKMQRPVVCLADTLLVSGYLKTDELQGLYQAWRNLITLVAPDILIMDYSPSAALAALDLTCKKIVVGNGFAEPAPGHPILSWHPQDPMPDLMQRQERRVVDTINQLQSSWQRPEITYISDLYRADRTILTVAPDFDMYASQRHDADYICQMDAPASAPTPQFSSNRKKVVAYLNHAHPQLDLILQGLAQSNTEVFVVCARCDEQKLAALASPTFHYSQQPVNLQALMQQADLMINHGNSGSSQMCIMQGKPLLTLPIHLEQLQTSLTVHQLGLGRLMQKPESAAQLATTIANMAEGTALQNNVRAYATRNQSLTRSAFSVTIADQCDAVLQTTGAQVS